MSPQEGRTESLIAALLDTYRDNPGLIAAREQVKAQDEAVNQAADAFGPKLNVSAQAIDQQSRVDEQVGPDQVSTVNTEGRWADTEADLVQPLYTGGRLTAEMNAAKAERLAADQALREAETRTFRAVVEAYVDVVRDTRVYAVDTHACELLTEQLGAVQLMLKAGAATVSDQAEITARLASAQAQLADAQAQLLSSQAAFRDVVGRDPGDLPEVQDIPGLPASLQDAIDASMRRNPTLRQAGFAELAARERVADARSAYAPQVSAEVSYQSSPVLATEPNLRQSSTAGVISVSIPLFDSGMRRAQVRQASHQQAAAYYTELESQRDVVQAVEVAWAALSGAKRALTLYDRQVHAQQTAFESYDDQYHAGLLSTIDLLNVEQELTGAQLARANAARDVVSTEADLLAAAGLLQADTVLPTDTPAPIGGEPPRRAAWLVGAGGPMGLVARTLDGVGAPAMSPAALPRASAVTAQSGAAPGSPQP